VFLSGFTDPHALLVDSGSSLFCCYRIFPSLLMFIHFVAENSGCFPFPDRRILLLLPGRTISGSRIGSKFNIAIDDDEEPEQMEDE